jgi:hypothetical protein
MSRVSRHSEDKKEEKGKRREVVPGIELGLPESESDVLTITLYNHLIFANVSLKKYKLFSKEFINHRHDIVYEELHTSITFETVET